MYKGSILCLLAALHPIVYAHSWVEEFQIISANGTYIGDRGFSRGYVPRSMFPSLNDGDKPMSYELPTAIDDARLRVNASDPLCRPSQQTSNYSDPAYPKLKVSPGEYVAMKYLENGHVTLPWTLVGKPDMGGTIFIYGTTQPSNDEKLVDVLKWTKDGKGGDGRGFLLSAQSFDDGRCHQVNSCVISAERQILYPNRPPGQTTGVGQEQWCESDVQIPATQPTGVLTIYWVWQWTTGTMADCNFSEGKDEYYTTCADFDIIDAPPKSQKLAAAVANINTLLQENLQTAAVSNWVSRTALTPSPVIILAESTSAAALQKIRAANTSNATFWSSCSSVASAAASAVSAGIKPTPPPLCPEGKWATGALFTSISAALMASLQSNAPASTLPASLPAQNTIIGVSTSHNPVTTSSTTPTGYIPTVTASTAATDQIPETTGSAGFSQTGSILTVSRWVTVMQPTGASVTSTALIDLTQAVIQTSGIVPLTTTVPDGRVILSSSDVSISDAPTGNVVLSSTTILTSSIALLTASIPTGGVMFSSASVPASDVALSSTPVSTSSIALLSASAPTANVVLPSTSAPTIPPAISLQSAGGSIIFPILGTTTIEIQPYSSSLVQVTASATPTADVPATNFVAGQDSMLGLSRARFRRHSRQFPEKMRGVVVR